MFDRHTQALKELRHLGYAVVVFNPEELKNANPRQVEDRLVEMSADVIDDLRED